MAATRRKVRRFTTPPQPPLVAMVARLHLCRPRGVNMRRRACSDSVATRRRERPGERKRSTGSWAWEEATPAAPAPMRRGMAHVSATASAARGVPSVKLLAPASPVLAPRPWTEHLTGLEASRTGPCKDELTWGSVFLLESMISRSN